MDKVGLVLEGGGMRGLFTAGVLDYLMEKDLYMPYVVGVSAGACQGASYVSKQIGRSKKINLKYSKDPRYNSFRNMFKEKSIFGMDFMFNEIPNKLVPFDYDTFYESSIRFIVGTANCLTGQTEYFEKNDSSDMLKVLRASCSLPFISPIVDINGLPLMDGGVTDPIPIKKAIKDGYQKNIIILTRNKTYRKKPFPYKRITRWKYKKYDGLVEAIHNRYKVYNETLDYLEDLAIENKVFIIRPQKTIQVDRMEKDPNKLGKLYIEGYEDMKNNFKELEKWLHKENYNDESSTKG